MDTTDALLYTVNNLNGSRLRRRLEKRVKAKEITTFSHLFDAVVDLTELHVGVPDPSPATAMATDRNKAHPHLPMPKQSVHVVAPGDETQSQASYPDPFAE